MYTKIKKERIKQNMKQHFLKTFKILIVVITLFSGSITYSKADECTIDKFNECLRKVHEMIIARANYEIINIKEYQNIKLQEAREQIIQNKSQLKGFFYLFPKVN
jgi:hypothetical protein